MKPGSLRKRLTFQKLSDTTNSFGEKTTWVAYYTCYGSVKQLAAQLIYSTGEYVGKETYDIRIRYTKDQDFSVGNRVLTEDGTTFQIDSVMNIQMRNREIQVLTHVLNQVV